MFNSQLDIKLGQFTEKEINTALKKIKWKAASDWSIESKNFWRHTSSIM